MKIKNGDYISFTYFWGMPGKEKRREGKGWVKQQDLQNQTLLIRRDDKYKGACATTIHRKDVLKVLEYKLEPPE